MSESHRDGEGELREMQARLRQVLNEAAAIRSDRSPLHAAEWVKKIQAAGAGLAAIAATGAVPSGEHLKLLAQTAAVIQAAFENHRDSLENGNFAIELACKEFIQRWGAPTQPEGPSR